MATTTVSSVEPRTLDLNHVAEGVFGLRTVMVNVYAVQSAGGGWVLVDGGLPYSEGAIERWTAGLYGPSSRPDSIVLTHGHFDHVGAVRRLAEKWCAPVFVHRLEMPYVTGRSPYPPPDASVGGGAMTFLSPLYPRGPADLRPRVQVLPSNGVIPGLPEWRWIHTPGHTAGHISLFRESDRTLIAGDAIITTKQESVFAVMTQRPELHGPPAYYTSDWEAARRSVEALARLRPAVAASGHGVPMGGAGLAGALEDLADRFDRIEKPKRGRYVRRPAVTDEDGIVTLPPPAPGSAMPALLAGAVAAGAVWYAVSRRKRS